jgi:hypothetical protein
MQLQLQTKLHTKRGVPMNHQQVSQTCQDTLQPKKAWQQEATAPCVIMAKMTSKGFTKPLATTAAHIE